MKKKNNIVETDGSAGGTVGGGASTMDVMNTSSTTAKSTKSTKSTTGKKKPTVYTKQINLKKTMDMLKNVDADVMVLEYLSEVKDAETGDISQPFTINGKKYQMVRAINPKKEKVMGVYSFDEMNEDGTNKIYDVKEFEDNIAKKAIMEVGVQEPEGPEAATLNPIEEKEHPSFAGYKHFIVNEKTGKARKFKSIEELAKAQMGEGEKYMGIREFKRYVDESLFGTSKRGMGVVNEVTPTGQETEEELSAKAKKLMAMISKRIPPNVLNTIRMPIAQREVIAAFAEMIGVPRNGLSKLIAGLKDIAKTGTNKPQPIEKGTEPTQANTTKPVTENRVIKTIKVKDIKQ